MTDNQHENYRGCSGACYCTGECMSSSDNEREDWKYDTLEFDEVTETFETQDSSRDEKENCMDKISNSQQDNDNRIGDITIIVCKNCRTRFTYSTTTQSSLKCPVCGERNSLYNGPYNSPYSRPSLDFLEEKDMPELPEELKTKTIESCKKLLENMNYMDMTVKESGLFETLLKSIWNIEYDIVYSSCGSGDIFGFRKIDSGDIGMTYVQFERKYSMGDEYKKTVVPSDDSYETIEEWNLIDASSKRKTDKGYFEYDVVDTFDNLVHLLDEIYDSEMG